MKHRVRARVHSHAPTYALPPPNQDPGPRDHLTWEPSPPSHLSPLHSDKQEQPPGSHVLSVPVTKIKMEALLNDLPV